MKRAILPSLVALLAGCKGEPIATKITLVSQSSEAVVVDVKTDPGATLTCAAGSLLIEPPDYQSTATADASGAVRLTIKQRGRGAETLQVECEASLGRRTGRDQLVARSQAHAKLDANGKVTFDGIPEAYSLCQGTVTWRAEDVEAKLVHCPAGTSVAIGNATATAAEATLFHEVTVVGKHDLASKAPDLEIAALLDPKDALAVELPLSVRFPGGSETPKTLRAPGAAHANVLEGLLQRLEKGPVVFPGDAEPASPGSLLVLGARRKLFGTARRVRDAERVALLSWVESVVDCGVYVDKNTGRRAQGTTVLKDVRARVYERRTGKRLGERMFKAPDRGCAETVKTRQASPEVGAGGDRTSADADEALAWAATFAK